jgi:hypothetical protein
MGGDMGVAWRGRLASYLAAAVVAGFLIGPVGHSVDAAAACNGVADSEAEASTLAEVCKADVVVNGSRTEFSQVVAQPDGRMQFESAVLPQRAYKAGTWADINLTLGRGADNLWRPAVSVADVAFSDGGSEKPLVTLTRGGKTMTMSWPQPQSLPKPTLIADPAAPQDTVGQVLQYSAVFPDVDLLIRATATGFTHTLVIKTPAAAALPQVKAVRLVLGGNAAVESTPDGLQAKADGMVIAETEPAVMWDSRSTSAAAQKNGPKQGAPVPPDGALATPSSATPGDAARTAPVMVQLSGKDLVLRPDQTMLNSTSTVFPLYVDPVWSVYKNKYAYATDDNSTNTTANTDAMVGRNPDTGKLHRSFFHFPTTANGVSLKGKYIASARVEMTLGHSWSCDKTPASMYWSAAINATPKANWSKMKLLRFVATASGRANEAGGCGHIQADMIMNFQGAQVTNLVRDAAKGGWSALGVGFRAGDNGSGESTQNRWKKFLPSKAKLFVDYDSPPGAPNSLQVSGVACPGSGVLGIGTVTPTFSAVFPDGDKDDSLKGVFEWIEVPAGGLGTVNDSVPARLPAPPDKQGVTPNARATSSSVSAGKNKTYAFRARGVDRPPYSMSSGWSGWCQFTIDTTVPNVSARMLTAPPLPGKAGRVRIESTDPTVTKFQYGWDAATKEVPAQGSNPRFAEVDITAARFGTNVLLVKAIDATKNVGNGSVEFVVGQPPRAVARWGLETYLGIDQQKALADRASSPADTPLTASNVTWPNDGRMFGVQTVTFNGTSSALSTTTAVVTTAGSFSVAAWVRLDVVPTSDMTVATQEGTSAAGFALGVRSVGGTPFWSFAMKDSSAEASALQAASAPTAITAADLGRWTFVAGVFDASEKKLRLYLDGTRVAEVDRAAAWPAQGRFVVGRGQVNGVATNWWNGSVADAQVFDRVLVGDDFTGRSASDPGSFGFNEPGILTPIQVGNWDFEQATNCPIANLMDRCEAPDTSTAGGRWLGLTRGADIGAGHTVSEEGLWLDNTDFPVNGDTPADTTDEYGRSAAKTGLTPPDGDGNQFTQWQDQPVVRTDQSFTLSAWAMPDGLEGGNRTLLSQTGAHESGAWLKVDTASHKWQFVVSSQDATTASFAMVVSKDDVEVGEWSHLSAVYDAGRREIRLYVNGEWQNTEKVPFTPMASNGPLLVGHTRWHNALADQWFGGIDNVAVFQGALNDATASAFYDRETSDPSEANMLTRGQSLEPGQSRESLNGEYALRMQPDGNLVLYHDGAVWSSETSKGHDNDGSYLIMQNQDGNAVIYKPDGHAIWATNTWDKAGDRLILYDNGDLVVLNTTGNIVWRR